MASAQLMAKLRADQDAVTQLAEMHSRQAAIITQRNNGVRNKTKQRTLPQQQQQQQQTNISDTSDQVTRSG